MNLKMMLAVFASLTLQLSPSLSRAGKDCAGFVAAVEESAGKKADADGKKLFTKICNSNTEAAVKSATECMRSNKGSGDRALNKCFKGLK